MQRKKQDSLRNEEKMEEGMLKDAFKKETIVLWLSLGALIVAAINLNTALNKLARQGEE